ncbi:hypothetical protein V1478_002926 [Vespula squamosa]|uniref:Uncharacterized protein n=1 Tax=Vespula squamosa TaxID=30214 RepID=A0ABD2BR84_VESSQ
MVLRLFPIYRNICDFSDSSTSENSVWKERASTFSRQNTKEDWIDKGQKSSGESSLNCLNRLLWLLRVKMAKRVSLHLEWIRKSEHRFIETNKEAIVHFTETI